LKSLHRPGMTRPEASLAALQALYDAADDDSATGGPDLTREMVEQRHARPDGPNAAV
jgi:proteasome beta subunit